MRHVQYSLIGLEIGTLTPTMPVLKSLCFARDVFDHSGRIGGTAICPFNAQIYACHRRTDTGNPVWIPKSGPAVIQLYMLSTTP